MTQRPSFLQYRIILLAEDTFYRFKLTVSVLSVRFEVSAFGPFVPAGKVEDRSFETARFEILPEAAQNLFKRFGSIVDKHRIVGVARRFLIHIRGDRARRRIPAGLGVGIIRQFQPIGIKFMPRFKKIRLPGKVVGRRELGVVGCAAVRGGHIQPECAAEIVDGGNAFDAAVGKSGKVAAEGQLPQSRLLNPVAEFANQRPGGLHSPDGFDEPLRTVEFEIGSVADSQIVRLTHEGIDAMPRRRAKRFRIRLAVPRMKVRRRLP